MRYPEFGIVMRDGTVVRPRVLGVWSCGVHNAHVEVVREEDWRVRREKCSCVVVVDNK